MACNSGKIVTVSYRGYLDSGWTFIEIPKESPIRFPCAHGWMPPEIIDTVMEMEPGETKTAHVSPENAYQERSDERIIRIPRKALSDDTALKPGDIAHLTSEDGTEYPARLISIDSEEAVFDANHGAVAQGLHFEITLHSVE